MLNINLVSTPRIASAHFDGVSFHINKAIDHYINIFEILEGFKSPNDAINILYENQDAHVINALIGRLCYGKSRKSKITKSKIVDILIAPKKHINLLFLENLNEFLSFFKELKAKLRELIISNPNQLLSLEKYFKVNYPFIVAANGSFMEPIRLLLLLGIFNYNKFSDKRGLPMDDKGVNYWERYDLAKALNVNTCAYCNRIYTFTVFNKFGNGIISPTIDHFFDKAKHPMFALSFYNLIPSCTNCNSTLKGQKEFTLTDYLHPYLDGFGEHAKFNYKALDVDATLGESDNLKVFIKAKPESPLKRQIENNIKLFQLDLIYSEHADYVRELIKKKIISNNRYLEILRFETYKDLNLSYDESYRLAFGNYLLDRDFQKRPLAKLTKDLLLELKMI